MKRSGPIPIVEVAYDLQPATSDWLRQSAERLRDMIPGSHSPWGWRMVLDEDGPPRIIDGWFEGVDDPLSMFKGLHDQMPPEYARAFFRPGIFSGNLRDNIERAVPSEELSETLREHLDRMGTSANLSMGFGGFDAFGHGVTIGIALPTLQTKARLMGVQQRIGVHLHTGRRLRDSLEGADPLAHADAVFEVDGRLAHLESAAGDARGALTHAVRSIDRARSRSERDRDESLELWQGLTEGRWSLIDRIDTDGRRYYVAVANPPQGIETRALSALERQIVGMAIAGEPNKVIGYALGLAPSTIGGKLSGAMRKLGVPSRIDLIRVGKRLLAGEVSDPASCETQLAEH